LDCGGSTPLFFYKAQGKERLTTITRIARMVVTTKGAKIREKGNCLHVRLRELRQIRSPAMHDTTHDRGADDAAPSRCFINAPFLFLMEGGTLAPLSEVEGCRRSRA